jgi:hypothetical protein
VVVVLGSKKSRVRTWRRAILRMMSLESGLDGHSH